MKAYEFTIDKPLEYVCTGKFEALSPNWIHETADLTDYELLSYPKALYTSPTRTRTIPLIQVKLSFSLRDSLPLTCAAASSLPTAAFTGCILSPLIRSPL